MTIGMIVPFLDNQYYPRLCNALAEVVSREGYILNILIHEDDKQLEKKMVAMLQGNHVDGIILNPINKGKELQKIMKNIHTNYCLLGIDEMPDCPCPCIGNDEKAAGAAAADYILRRGYRDILFVAPALYDREGARNFGHHRRLEGIRGRLAGENVRLHVITGEGYAEETAELAGRRAEDRPAVLCSGETFATEVIRDMNRRGRRLGVDYGLMTFDHSEAFGLLSSSVVAVDNHVERIGEAAGRIIMQLCGGVPAEQKTVIPFEIVRGNTL